MRFLVDAQLPPKLCRWFEGEGFESTHVFEVLGYDVPDPEVAAFAARHGWTIVTKDSDFVALSRKSGCRLLWLRCGNQNNRAMVQWLQPRRLQVHEAAELARDIVELR